MKGKFPLPHRGELRDWILRGKAQGSEFLIVVTDTFNYEDYPVYAKNSEECVEKREAYSGKNMQRVRATYKMEHFEDD
jgi:hypothetical protein